MKANFQKSARYCHLSKYIIVGFLVMMLLPACSSGLKVRHDIDPTVDFSRYTNYNFFDPMGIEGGFNSPEYGEHFRSALSRELENRGYRMTDQPGLLVNVTMRADDKVSMKVHTAPYMSGAYYSRPGGPYAGSAVGVGVGVGSRPTKTTEASVFIDLVDVEQRKIVWQGVAMVKADEKVALRLRDAIYTSVNKVMTLYPHTAGN